MVKPILSTVSLAHLPGEVKVNVALYKGVKNTRYLRKQLIEQNKDFEYAFIDARKVLSTTHVLAAVFRTVNDDANGRLKSHNVHSEIVLSLNITNNIGDALRKFGIADQTSSLLVIKVTSRDPTEVETQLEQAVEGEAVEFSNAELANLQDLNEIRKVYKLGQAPTSKSRGVTKSASSHSNESSSQDIKDLEASILGLIALRGVA